MNIINEIEKMFNEAGLEEARAQARLLVTEVSELNLEDILLDKKIENVDKIYELANRRIKERVPIQYLIGYSYFMGEKYKVDNSVLIPRDETEILVKKCASLLENATDKLDILDIGVGSGCISCALAKNLKHKDIEILGVDISTDAIKIALDNIERLDLVRKVILRKSDLFSAIREEEKFDLIVSNPPYIPKKEEKNLQIEVLKEPKIALFTEDDKGIEFYEHIIKKAPQYLKSGGFIAFELGINESEAVIKMLENDFKDIETIKDLAGIDRVITAKYKV